MNHLINHALVALGMIGLGFANPAIVTANTAVRPNENSSLHITQVQATGLDGKAFDGGTLEGKIVLLDFWAVWCGPCLTAFPDLMRLNREYGDKNFEVIGIASYSGTTDDVRAVVERYDVDYTIVMGEVDLITKFRVVGMPTYFLMGRDGAVAGKYVGDIEDLFGRIASDIDAIIGDVTAKQ